MNRPQGPSRQARVFWILSTLALSFAMRSFAADSAGPMRAVGDGQSVKVWVAFKDKGPASAAWPRTSRAFENLALYPPYVQALALRGLVPDVRLKWQNRVSGYVKAESIPDLRGLPFVVSVALMPRKAREAPLPLIPFPWRPGALAKRAAEGLDYGAGRSLMESLRVDKVHAYLASRGTQPGRGMRVAVIDADFHLGSPIFAAMKGRIRDQYDFVDDDPVAATDSLLDSHGAQCMSLIGGNLPGTLVGGAPEADFLLYRAEDAAQERYVEEDYVAAAIERAVDSGAQVISISLGYRYDFSDGKPDVPYASFDGRTRPSSLAALGAARRDVLVAVSMGNMSGNEPPEPTLNAPADADSILAVGIADPLRRRCGYSCTGPSADGRVKPDVMSMGVSGACLVAVANTDSSAGSVNSGGGTSYAAPVIAGVGVLLRQLRPDLPAQAIRLALIRSADHAGHPDGMVGYGVVDAAAAAGLVQIPVNPPLTEEGLVRVYHQGGTDPIRVAWDPGQPPPKLELISPSGRRIPMTVRLSGPLLMLTPGRVLRTGVYIIRTR